ncbi:FAD-binding oxidoreductase [Candidatus Poribacteria bacterium]|nr:FAD-binding oxidoreductase [Candidatus Poribacteria bacterium]
MKKHYEVIIIGAGIWGLSTAYHLAKYGQKGVLVLERNSDIAAETTPQAAGLVGQIRSTDIMFQAIHYALDLFSNFPKETGYDTSLQQTGSLMIALTPERMDAYKKQIIKAKKNNIEADFISDGEISKLVPSINLSKIEGGFFVPNDGYVDPYECASAYANAAKDLGVEISFNTPVKGLCQEKNEIHGVETNEGIIESANVIITAGPWGALLVKETDTISAVQPIRHQRARTMPTDNIPDVHPVVRIPDLSCYLRPEKGGYLYGYFEPNPVSIDLEKMPAEFRTKDLEQPITVMKDAKNRLSPIFPILNDLDITEYNRGMTTFSPDGAYMIGPVSGIDRLYLATGCAALGIAGSAAVGKWLSNWVMNGDPGEDISDFSHERFGDKVADLEWLRRETEDCYANYYSIRTE